MKNVMAVVQDLKQTFRREVFGARFRPVSGFVYPTYLCSSRCRTCNIWQRNKESIKHDEMAWGEWKHVFDQMKASGINDVEIFGGDALIRKDIVYNMIEYGNQIGMKSFFPTNSLSFDDETAENLVRAGLDTIYFSLDDINSMQDHIRGKKGSFSRVVKAIEDLARLRKNGKPRIIVISVISKMNYRHLPDIIDFLSKYPIDAFYPRVMEEHNNANIDNSLVNGIKPEPYFAPTDGESHLLSVDEVKEFREVIKGMKSSVSRSKKIWVNYRAVDSVSDEVFTKSFYDYQKCQVCTTLVTVDPMGNVTPCPMYNKYYLGNLLENSLDEIWGNEMHRDFVKMQREKKLKICENCCLQGFYPNTARTLTYYFKKAMERIGSRLFNSKKQISQEKPQFGILSDSHAQEKSDAPGQIIQIVSPVVGRMDQDHSGDKTEVENSIAKK